MTGKAHPTILHQTRLLLTLRSAQLSQDTRKRRNISFHSGELLRMKPRSILAFHEYDARDFWKLRPLVLPKDVTAAR